MKYQQIINNNSIEKYNTSKQIRFKTTILKSSLCDYSDAYISVKGTITIAGAGAKRKSKTRR